MWKPNTSFSMRQKRMKEGGMSFSHSDVKMNLRTIRKQMRGNEAVCDFVTEILRSDKYRTGELQELYNLCCPFFDFDECKVTQMLKHWLENMVLMENTFREDGKWKDGDDDKGSHDNWTCEFAEKAGPEGPSVYEYEIEMMMKGDEFIEKQIAKRFLEGLQLATAEEEKAADQVDHEQLKVSIFLASREGDLLKREGDLLKREEDLLKREDCFQVQQRKISQQVSYSCCFNRVNNTMTHSNRLVNLMYV